MPVQLIVTADDLGASESINSAVRLARRAGVLTSASLLVAGDAAAGAVELARDDPLLAVGLHLALSSGRSVMPREAILDLVNRESCFESDPVRASLRYYFHRRARRQLGLEIEAQFEAFAATGLTLSHVDGHQHLHAHPAVLPTVIEMAIRFGAAGIRIPCDPVWPNLCVDRSRLICKLTTALGHAYLRRVCSRLVARSGLATCEVVIGSMMSGRMREGYVIEMLRRVKCENVEFFCHPDEVGGSHEPFGSNPGDFAALISPGLRRFVDESGFELTSYAGLRRREAAHVRG